MRKKFPVLKANNHTRALALEALQRDLRTATTDKHSELVWLVKRRLGVSASEYITTQEQLIAVVKTGVAEK